MARKAAWLPTTRCSSMCWCDIFGAVSVAVHSSTCAGNFFVSNLSLTRSESAKTRMLLAANAATANAAFCQHLAADTAANTAYSQHCLLPTLLTQHCLLPTLLTAKTCESHHLHVCHGIMGIISPAAFHTQQALCWRCQSIAVRKLEQEAGFDACIRQVPTCFHHMA